jgi:hypothetical protein
MTLQLLHSEFPYIWWKICILFYPCIFLSLTKKAQLKGVWQEIFSFWFFRRSVFHGSEYPIWTISNFVRKFANIFECKWKWEKFWDKVFSHILFNSFWLTVYTYWMNFSKTFILKWRQAAVTGDKLSPVLYYCILDFLKPSLPVRISYRSKDTKQYWSKPL